MIWNYLSYFKGRKNFDIFEVVPTSEECFYNLYSNQLLDRVEKGWIIFLDDDDMFSGVDVLKKINGSIKNFDNNAIFFWYHKRSDRVIYPPDLRNIQKSSIASCSYCFNSKYKNLSRWNTGQTGDFEFLDQLLRKISSIELELVKR